MKHIYLLYNPKSGRETIKNSLADILEIYARAGYEVIARPTLYKGEATEITAALPADHNIDVLVCCGGDGTLSEVVAGSLLRETPINLGYIPCGSTNDFGNTIYGSVDKIQAAKNILHDEPHAIDCGKLGDKTFVYAAAFGLFTDVTYETPHNAKAALGYAAYLLEATKALGNIKSNKVKAVIDDGEVIEGEFLVGMVTNADSVGGIANITGKNIDLRDGVFELTLIARPEKAADYGKVLQAITEGTQNDFVIRRKIKKASFTFGAPTSFTLDGEYGGTYESVDFECVPEAFTLIY